MTAEELTQLLIKYEVPYKSWGTESSKTFEHLLKELNVGECRFVEKEDELYRLVRAIVMDVYFITGNKTYKLVEDRQEYINGRVVRRGLKNSVLEKLMPDEDPFDGAKRALAEELGITTDVELIDKGETHEVSAGKSYPGTINEGTLFNYEAYLSEDQFVQEGYIEVQEDKTNYYIWQNV